MVSIVKNWMGLNKKEVEEIPEIHLQKNEPKFYYNDKLKKWVIEGQEQEEEKKSKLPPPKKDIKSSDKKKTAMIGTRRYASALGDDSIYTPETPTPKEENKIIENNKKDLEKEEENKANNEKSNINENKDNNIESTPTKEENETKEEKEIKDDKDEYQPGTNKAANNFNYNNIKILNSLQKQDGKSEISDISHREDFISNYQTDINECKKNIIEEEIIKIKEEYDKKLKLMETEYETQLNELKEINQFSEETYNETTSILKNQINNFIKENLELKSNAEKLSDEIEFHKKEVKEYKNLFEHYKKLVEENNNKVLNTPGGEEEGNSESNQNLISSVIVEKLESEKMILNNDIIELKNENESYKIEKELYIAKNKKLEEENEQNKNKINELEKTIQEQKVNINLMNNKKDKKY